MENKQLGSSLTWQEGWNSGKKILDAKREAIVQEINNIGLLIEQGERSGIIGEHLAGVNHNIADVFDLEQELMTVHNYPSANHHIQQHQHLLDLLSALRVGVFRPLNRLELYLTFRTAFVSHLDHCLDQDLIGYIRKGNCMQRA